MSDPFDNGLSDAMGRTFDQMFVIPSTLAEVAAMPPMHFNTNSVAIRVSDEVAMDFGIIAPSRDRLAELGAWHDKWRAEDAARQQQLAAMWSDLLAADAVTVAVVNLHAPDDRMTCQGCDIDGYEAEAPEWPCRTVEALYAHLTTTPPTSNADTEETPA